MRIEKLREILEEGEGLKVEFKQSKKKLNKDVYESVCAFLNRHGGHLLLGIEDSGMIVGVDPDVADDIKNKFITTMNNPLKISPTGYLSVEQFEIDGKIVLYILVPESSQVHRCKGRIYDRNEDGDMDITDNTTLVSNLYIRKQGSYTENRIYPFAEISELRSDVFRKVRRLVSNQRADHPWIMMDDLEMLKSAGLYRRDLQSGEEGITLAGILLLGTDELISAALPHYRTDAILRKENIDRYDDRDDVRTNLIDSYGRLMQFISKHLNDKFHLEGDQRISLRDKIFREVVSNSLVHREFANPFPAKIIIENDKVVAENSNKPHYNGIIDPRSFSPYPKNPTIAKFFKEIGWVEELGSGVRNIYKYNKIYSGAEPLFIEEDIFKTIIPLVSEGNSNITNQATNQADCKTEKILEFCIIPRSRDEIQKLVGLNNRGYFKNKILKLLIKDGLLKMSIPDKPTSPNQKYYYEKEF